MNGAEGFISAMVEMLEAYRIVTTHVVKRLNTLESRLSGSRVPLMNNDIVSRLENLEAKINEPGYIEQLTDKVSIIENSLDRIKALDEKKFDELYAVQKNIPLGDLINRLEKMEEVFEHNMRDYDSKLEELYTMRNDIDIISKELIELKSLTKELAEIVSKEPVE